MKVRSVIDDEGGRTGWMVFCPGCRCGHFFPEGRWTFNGDSDRPTFNPSMLIITSDAARGKVHLCHSFVRDGQIQFLSDCEHKLAGQTVELPDF